MKTMCQFGFGKEIKTRCAFTKEHYLTCCEQVKSGFERALQPASSLGQRRNLPEFPREQHDNSAGLAEIGDAQDHAFCFLAGHDGFNLEWSARGREPLRILRGHELADEIVR